MYAASAVASARPVSTPNPASRPFLRAAPRGPATSKNCASPASCDQGYPRIVLLDRSGRALPFAYRHGGDQEITNAAPTWVVIRPSRQAFMAINKNACVTFAERLSLRIRITLPNTRRAFELPMYSAIRPDAAFGYCAPTDPGHEVDVTPIEPTQHATGSGY